MKLEQNICAGQPDLQTGEHLRDEEQTTPDAHDDVAHQAHQNQAANGNVLSGCEQRQKNEDCNGRMDGYPEPLEGHARTALYYPNDDGGDALHIGITTMCS